MELSKGWSIVLGLCFICSILINVYLIIIFPQPDQQETSSLNGLVPIEIDLVLEPDLAYDLSWSYPELKTTELCVDQTCFMWDDCCGLKYYEEDGKNVYWCGFRFSKGECE